MELGDVFLDLLFLGCRSTSDFSPCYLHFSNKRNTHNVTDPKGNSRLFRAWIYVLNSAEFQEAKRKVLKLLIFGKKL